MPVEKPSTGRKRASSRPTRSSTSEARWRAARMGRPLSSPKVDTRSAAVWSGARQSCSGMNPRRLRTPIGSSATALTAHLDPARRSGGSARGAGGTASSCRRRWPPPARPSRGDRDGQLLERDGATSEDLGQRVGAEGGRAGIHPPPVWLAGSPPHQARPGRSAVSRRRTSARGRDRSGPCAPPSSSAKATTDACGRAVRADRGDVGPRQAGEDLGQLAAGHRPTLPGAGRAMLPGWSNDCRWSPWA